MKKKKSRKHANKRDCLPLEEDIMDDNFCFIAGYTGWGFPYGVTWEEMGIDQDMPFEEKKKIYDEQLVPWEEYKELPAWRENRQWPMAQTDAARNMTENYARLDDWFREEFILWYTSHRCMPQEYEPFIVSRAYCRAWKAGMNLSFLDVMTRYKKKRMRIIRKLEENTEWTDTDKKEAETALPPLPDENSSAVLYMDDDVLPF